MYTYTLNHIQCCRQGGAWGAEGPPKFPGSVNFNY